MPACGRQRGELGSRVQHGAGSKPARALYDTSLLQLPRFLIL